MSNITVPEEALVEKVIAGERVSEAEALLLYKLPLHVLGALADHRRNLAKRTSYEGSGEQVVTYIVDRNVNYTNVCNVYCKFCAFYRTEKDSDHYVLTHSELEEKLSELSAIGGVQVLLQGGHHPQTANRALSRHAFLHQGALSSDQYSWILPPGISSLFESF